MHIITMLLLLSVLILVHEFGHYIAAIKLGIKVDKFGFGLPFGPTLYKTKWGETEVCVHAFLLGGYVSFPDEDPDSNIPKESMERINNRKVWERAVVVSAGVISNIIIAYLIVIFVAMGSRALPTGKYLVYVHGLQENKTLPAYQIGIKQGDRIVSANNVTIDTLNKFVEITRRSKKFDNYANAGIINTRLKQIKLLNPALTSKLKSDNEIIPSGIKINLPAPPTEEPVTVGSDVLDNIKKYTPEGKLLTANERKLRNSLDGANIWVSDGKYTLSELAASTSDTVHPVEIVISRNGKNITLPKAYPNNDGMIGVKLKLQEVTNKIANPADAVVKSWNYLEQNTSYMIKGLCLIFTGQVPLTDIHGIVAITKVGSDIITNRGIWDGLLLTALISMDLAIVNLLPIPALDGGHLLFLFIEKLRGRPVEEKTQEAFAKYGFMFLIGLMILIIFNDIFALVTDKL